MLQKAGRILKKVFMWGLGLLGVTLVVLAGLLVFVFTHPKDTWAFVETRVLPKDLHITWQKLEFDGAYLGNLNFRVMTDFHGLLIQKENPRWEVPVGRLRLRTSVFPRSNPKAVVHELILDAAEKVFWQGGPPAEEEAEPQNPFQILQKALHGVGKFQQWVQIEKLDANVADFEFRTFAGQPILLSLSAHQPDAKDQRDTLDLNAKVILPGKNEMRLTAVGALKQINSQSKSPFFEALLSFLGFDVKTEQTFKLTARGEAVDLVSHGPVFYKKDKLNIRLRPWLAATLEPSQSHVDLRFSAEGIPGPLVQLRDVQATADIPFEKDQFWSEKPTEFTVSGPFELFFIDKNMRRPIQKSCDCRIPEELHAKIEGRAWIATLFGKPKTKKEVLDAKLDLESVKNKLLSVDIKAAVRMQKEGDQYFFAPFLDGLLVVNSFQGLRQFLDAKNILIPAPVDKLEGTLRLVAKGPVENAESGWKFPIQFVADLASKGQSVKASAITNLHLLPDLQTLNIEVAARIQELYLQLPPLDPIRGIPRITPDSRILREPVSITTAKPSKFKVKIGVSVETVNPGAIRLSSEFAKPYVPLTLKIARDSAKDTGGFIRLEPFAIEYLRRRVNVENFRMDLSHIEKNVLPVKGRFRIDQNPYQIFIDIGGTVRNPLIKLSSDPDLSQDDIISVLLYGRVNDRLVAMEAETAGSVQAAMADRAIGLFGLWAFASTPIQSFSYNAVTKIYTATLKISDDLTAGIGTNWEETTSLELRKRISRQWVLTASWGPGPNEGESIQKLVLQWERRF